MAAKKKSAKKSAKSSLSIVRGGDRFDLTEVEDLFAIKRRRGTRRGELATAHEHPGAFAGVEFCANQSTSDVEVFRVDADSRDDAMARLRESGTDSHWCAHVYHMGDDADGLMIPTDSIYVELAPDADPGELNALLTEHGLEAMPLDEDPSHLIFRLTSASTMNPIKIANALMNHAAVALAEPDFSMKMQLLAYRPTDTLFAQQWHLENLGGVAMTAGADVRAPDAWDITRGSRSIRICVMDDGVQTAHPDFASNGKIVSPRDFGQNDLDPNPVETNDNHGTACAGVAVADENGTGVVGIAPGCALMPYRTSGFIDDQSIADLFDSARTDGADVISCSWGVATPFYTLSTRMKRVITRAATEGRDGRGCVILFASGNEDSPVDGVVDGRRVRSGFAIHPDVIAVNASTSNDVRSHYSNFGRETWICAPSSGAGGRRIVTTDRTGSAGYQSGSYTTINGFGGTSSACPLVAGICGLMLSVNPNLTALEVKEILRDTAVKIDPANGDYDGDGHSEWYGHGRADAALAVAEAQRRGSSVTTRTVTFESVPTLEIPDHQPAGVTDAIVVGHEGPVAGVAVSVEIDHTYRGDLRVDLIGPDGTTVTLHDRVGSAADDVIETYTLTDTPALRAFVDRGAAGAWSLRVSDHAAHDVGMLVQWTLSLELATGMPQIEWEARPGAHIPDDDETGIESQIQVTESGPLSDIAVAVDITHTWRGDLEVVLETPGGNQVQLHDRQGSSADDLVRTYTAADYAALRTLVDTGEDISGTWTLRVSDHAGQDVGKLNAWKLTLLTGASVLVPTAPSRAGAARRFTRALASRV